MVLVTWVLKICQYYYIFLDAKYQEKVLTLADRLEMLQGIDAARGHLPYFKLQSVKRSKARKIYLANKERVEEHLRKIRQGVPKASNTFLLEL